VTTVSRSQAEHAIARYHERVAALRSDTKLSDEGRAKFIALEWVATRSVVDGYHTARAQAAADRVTTARRKLFGTPGTGALDSLSIRNARDRARRAIEAGKVDELLGEALHTNDVTLGKAAVEAALQTGNIPGLNRWNAHHPSDEVHLQTLVDADPDAELRRDMAEHVAVPSPSLPPELAAVGERGAVELAGSEVGVRIHIAQVLAAAATTAPSAASPCALLTFTSPTAGKGWGTTPCPRPLHFRQDLSVALRAVPDDPVQRPPNDQ
jgi:hypothetical protein